METDIENYLRCVSTGAKICVSTLVSHFRYYQVELELMNP